MEEILSKSATEAAKSIRNKEFSSRELTEMVLNQIDKVNPQVNAVVDLHRETALNNADDADIALANGDEVGPLHGVPMTIKDSFDVAGMHTTWGNPAFKNYVATEDATVVKRLKQGGANIIGKSNVAFMLADFAQTANDLHGVTNNPLDLKRSPGGSSGGAAAAVASGMSFLEYVSDLAGSARIPASACGIYGLKPSVNTVPLSGFQVPYAPSIPSDMNYLLSLGPLARSAADLRASLGLTAGPEHSTAKAYEWKLSPSRHKTLRDFRVGVVLDHPAVPVSSEVGKAMSETVDALTKTGVKIVEGWPEGIDPMQTWQTFGFHVQLFMAFQQPSPDFAKLTEFIEQEKQRMSTRFAWDRYFENIDVFLCPTNITTAIEHDDRPFEQRTISIDNAERSYNDQTFWISQPSLPGLPAVSAPIGTSKGLSIGMQIVGPIFEDNTAITFAELLADVISV